MVCSQRGVSLIIVLVMLVLVGMLSAAALRSASSNEMVARSFRHQMLAQEYAEAALRYCESQLLLADAQRVRSLQNAQLPVSERPSAWTARANWNGSGPSGTSLTALPMDYVAPSGAGPQVPPQCLAEKRPWSPGESYRLTARGFSPTYTRDSEGLASTGVVVWLQVDVLIQADPSTSSRVIHDRVWTRILNPPFY